MKLISLWWQQSTVLPKQTHCNWILRDIVNGIENNKSVHIFLYHLLKIHSTYVFAKPLRTIILFIALICASYYFGLIGGTVKILRLMLCWFPWLACPFLNGDRRGMNGVGIGRWREGKLRWVHKINRKFKKKY